MIVRRQVTTIPHLRCEVRLGESKKATSGDYWICLLILISLALLFQFQFEFQNCKIGLIHLDHGLYRIIFYYCTAFYNLQGQQHIYTRHPSSSHPNKTHDTTPPDKLRNLFIYITFHIIS